MTDSITAFKVIRSRRRKKTMTLQITREGNVVIRVPLKTPDTEVERFLLPPGMDSKKTKRKRDEGGDRE